MADNELVRTALGRRNAANIPENQPTTYEFGGDTTRSGERLPVKEFTEEQHEQVMSLLVDFGSHIQKRVEQGGDLTQADAIIVDLLSRDPSETFSPHEMAGLYVAFGKMLEDIQDPKSAVYQNRRYDNPNRSQEQLDKFNELRELRSTIFWNLTRFDDTRSNLQVRELPSGGSRLWHEIGGRLKLTESMADIRGKRNMDLARRDSFERHHKILFSAEQIIDSKGRPAAAKVLEEAGLTKARIEAVNNAVGDVAKRTELAKYITGPDAPQKIDRIMLQIRRETMNQAVEASHMSRLDSLIEETLQRENPIQQAEIEDAIEGLNKDLNAAKKRLETLKKNRDTLVTNNRNTTTIDGDIATITAEIQTKEKDLKRKRALLKIAAPANERAFRKSENRDLESIAKLTGLDQADLLADFGTEFGLSGTGLTDNEVNKRLRKQDSVGLWQKLMEVLTR